MSTSSSQSYGPTSGLVTGWFAGILLVVVALLVLFSGSVAWASGVLALALFVWSVLARPRVLLDPPALELRNAFSSWKVPLAAIETIDVRHSTVVTTAQARYVGDGVGRTVAELARGEEPHGIPAVMVQHVRAAMAAAKETDATPVKEYAVPQLVVLGVLVLVFLVGVVL